MAARAYTHGWDIFHVPALPIYHLYDTGGSEAPRPKHWTEGHDKQRPVRWWVLEERSKARVSALLCEGKNLGVYGLGTQRTLADYARFCGIDYASKTLTEQARQGPWVADK